MLKEILYQDTIPTVWSFFLNQITVDGYELAMGWCYHQHNALGLSFLVWWYYCGAMRSSPSVFQSKFTQNQLLHKLTESINFVLSYSRSVTSFAYRSQASIPWDYMEQFFLHCFETQRSLDKFLPPLDPQYLLE